MQSRCSPPADAPGTTRWLLAGLPLETSQPQRARPRPVARRYLKARNRRRGQQRSHRQCRSGPPAARHLRPQRRPAQSTPKCPIATSRCLFRQPLGSPRPSALPSGPRERVLTGRLQILYELLVSCSPNRPLLARIQSAAVTAIALDGTGEAALRSLFKDLKNCGPCIRWRTRRSASARFGSISDGPNCGAMVSRCGFTGARLASCVRWPRLRARSSARTS